MHELFQIKVEKKSVMFDITCKKAIGALGNTFVFVQQVGAAGAIGRGAALTFQTLGTALGAYAILGVGVVA